MYFRRGYWIAALLLIAIGTIWTIRRNASSVFDAPALVTQIQKLNELASVKYSVQKVVAVEEQKAPFGKESLLLVVQGKAVAGVDLAQMKEGDIVREGEAVYVNLPPAKMLHVYLDEKQTKVWDRKVTWWTPWIPFSPDLETKARQQAIQSVEQTASEMGILKEAERNAHLAIASLLKAAGFAEVRFRAQS